MQVPRPGSPKWSGVERPLDERPLHPLCSKPGELLLPAPRPVAPSGSLLLDRLRLRCTLGEERLDGAAPGGSLLVDLLQDGSRLLGEAGLGASTSDVRLERLMEFLGERNPIQ